MSRVLVVDARRVAETMGFPHYVLDYENTFREAVIEEFADAYLAGATPVPCIRCNERVKFKDLLATAKDLEADCMATGHYIQRKLGIGYNKAARLVEQMEEEGVVTRANHVGKREILVEER